MFVVGLRMRRFLWLLLISACVCVLFVTLGSAGPDEVDALTLAQRRDAAERSRKRAKLGASWVPSAEDRLRFFAIDAGAADPAEDLGVELSIDDEVTSYADRNMDESEPTEEDLRVYEERLLLRKQLISRGEAP
jgi:hypothetical protein